MNALKHIKPIGWLLIVLIAAAIIQFGRYTVAEYSTYTPDQKQEFWEAIADGVNQGVEAGSKK